MSQRAALLTFRRSARPGRAIAPLLALLALAACDRKPSVPATDSVIPAPPAPVVEPPAPVAATSRWDADAGLALVVPGEEGDAHLVVPGTGAGEPSDTTSGRVDAVLPGEAVLLSRSGVAGKARVTAGPPRAADACATWPAARLGPSSGADAVPAWTVGLVVPAGSPTVVALPLDSLHGLASSDSAALAAAVTRVASRLPTDGESRRLRGLPFVVRAAGRFRPGSGAQAVVAVLSRTLAQEASPVAETILLVAERPASAAAGAPWSLAYHERAVGREETLASVEVLAALQLGADHHATLVVARGMDDGSRYTLLERVGAGRWRVRWTSAAPRC